MCEWQLTSTTFNENIKSWLSILDCRKSLPCLPCLPFYLLTAVPHCGPVCSLYPFPGGPAVDTNVHFPPSIVAQNGTAGNDELKPWIGHDAGGHAMLLRLRAGQHGLVPQA